MVSLEVIVIGSFLVIGLICLIILSKVKRTQRHLRQIEKKIDTLYTQSRTKDYAFPSSYPFLTKKF